MVLSRVDHPTVGSTAYRAVAARPARLAAAAALFAVVAGCSGQSGQSGAPGASPATSATVPPTWGPARSGVGGEVLLPGMPAYPDPRDVYAADRPGALAAKVRADRPLVYVPNTLSNDVSVIDQRSMRVIARFAGGAEPQHVVPSYDLRTLYVAADKVPGGSLTPIDPRTGAPGRPIRVADPYNLYFTPDGRSAIVVAEAYRRLDFYDPRTFRRQLSVPLPDCAGVDHLDFTADGRLALASCEFADRMAVIDVPRHRYLRSIRLDRVPGGMPQDVRLTPDGSVFYVADMMANGVYEIDGRATRVLGFVPTGRGAHGIYFDRASRRAFVTNRGEGTISVLDLATRRVAATWRIPGGGSPDMGGVSADGTVLWLSGRYNGVVYAISTAGGRLLAKIPVGAGPHGLCVWPQPGRYSLGHTSNLR
jgi:YVTN family beta-propeller protein